MKLCLGGLSSQKPPEAMGLNLPSLVICINAVELFLF